MKKIVALKERDFADAGKCDTAPRDFEDAMDNYDRVLDIVGEICGDVLAENAEGVDHEGPQVIDGRVKYAPGTQRNHDVLVQAGLYGMSLPREYDGLNFPIVPISGDCRIAPRRFTSLRTRIRSVVSCLARQRATRTRWI